MTGQTQVAGKASITHGGSQPGMRPLLTHGSFPRSRLGSCRRRLRGEAAAAKGAPHLAEATFPTSSSPTAPRLRSRVRGAGAASEGLQVRCTPHADTLLKQGPGDAHAAARGLCLHQRSLEAMSSSRGAARPALPHHPAAQVLQGSAGPDGDRAGNTCLAVYLVQSLLQPSTHAVRYVGSRTGSATSSCLYQLGTRFRPFQHQAACSGSPQLSAHVSTPE